MRHAFVDESFAGPYLVAAAILPAGDVAGARQAVRGLLDRQQRRLHFKDESDQRKRRILETLAELDLQARVYVTTNSRAARKDCLTQLVPDLANAGVTRLVIERDDSLIEFDRRTLYQLVKAGRFELEYQHLRAHEDLLLCVADAVAWCAAKGGPWRERIEPYTSTFQI